MSQEASGHSPVETIYESTAKLIPHYCLEIQKVNNCASYSLLRKLIEIRQSMSRMKQDSEEVRINILGSSTVPELDVLNILLFFLPLPSHSQFKPDINLLAILVVHIDANADRCNEFYSSCSKSSGLLLLGETVLVLL